jgi:hypothetical protein
MKIRLGQAELFHADGRTDRWTDMTYLIVTIHSFANAPETHKISQMQLLCCKQSYSSSSGKGNVKYNKEDSV